MDFGLLTLPVLAISAILGYSVFFSTSTVLLRDIDVPKSAYEEGYSSRVMSARLANEVRTVNRRARTVKEQRDIALPDDPTAVNVVADQFEFLKPIKATQEMMGLVEFTFGGEITKADGGYAFTVRGEDHKRGRSLDSHARGARPDELLRPVAIDMVRFVDPYIVASYYYEITRDAGGADYGDAIREIRNCMITLPKEERHWPTNLMGLVLLQQGKPDDAIEKFREAKAGHADFILPDYNIGVAYAAKGKYDEAITKYKEVLARDAEKKTRYPHAFTQWGVALAAQGKPDEAIAKFRQAVQADPNYADVYNAWGKVLRDTGKTAEARDMFQQAADRVPERVEYRNNLKSVPN